MYKQKMQDVKAITLIALVITIVVLIILATITINIVINGGIFSAAKEAKLFQANAVEYDKAKVEEATNIIKELTERENNPEGYGLRSDGKFYCDPTSIIGIAYR